MNASHLRSVAHRLITRDYVLVRIERFDRVKTAARLDGLAAVFWHFPALWGIWHSQLLINAQILSTLSADELDELTQMLPRIAHRPSGTMLCVVLVAGAGWRVLDLTSYRHRKVTH